MTMKHMIHGLMQATNSKTHYQMAKRLDIAQKTVTWLINERQHSISMSALSHAQEVTGIPFDTLFAWYRLPTHAPLEMATVEQPV